MRIEIQLRVDAAQEIQGWLSGETKKGDLRPATRELATQAEKLGITLQPMFPGQTHPLLAPYFFADVPDRPMAERVMDRLLRLEAVEGAYLGPAPELPT